MKLKEFCVKQGWGLGFAEIRRFVAAGAITINGETAVNADIELNDGDIVTLGKRRVAIVKEN